MMDAMGTTTLLSFEEFEQLPSAPGKMELLDGELIRLPPAKFRHERIIHQLYKVLRPQVENSGLALGEPYIKMGYRLSCTTWLKPAVSITHLNQPSTDYLEGAPLLAVEADDRRGGCHFPAPGYRRCKPFRRL